MSTSECPQVDVQTIAALIAEVGAIAPLQPTDDFYDAGFASIGALQLLLELEERFNVTLDDASFAEARTPEAVWRLVCDAMAGATR